MRELQFVGVAEDGEHLLLKDTAGGEKFLLPIDERLRAASRGDRSRLGQIELALDSPVRPREIQARIRAGETPEEVAAAAGAPLDRVMRFAYPVLQERAQVAGEARRTRIRRSEFANRLGEQVDDRLSRQGVDLETTVWDASRREDSIWWVTLTWPAGKKQQRAQWTFDLPGHTLTPANDLAAELQAEQPKVRRPFTAAPFVPVANAPADETAEGEPEARPPAAPTRPAQAPRETPPAPPEAAGRVAPRLRPDPDESPAPPPGLPEATGLTAAPEARTAHPAATQTPAPDADAPDADVLDADVLDADDASEPSAAPARANEPAGGPAVRPVTELSDRRAREAAESGDVAGAPGAGHAAADAADGLASTPAPDSGGPGAAASSGGKSRGRGRKAKVPAWEDIVFGARGPK
jgi:hypothetical protein